MTTITIEYQHYNALVAMIPKKDFRYYLHGIALRIVGSELHATATNGSALLDVKLMDVAPDGLDWQEKIIPLPFKKVSKKQGAALFTFQGDGKVSCTTQFDGNTTTVVEPIDGKYPDVSKVMPDGQVSASRAVNQIGMDTRLVNDVSKAYDDTFAVTFNGKSDAMLLTMPKFPNVKCVLMPVRL